MELIDWISLNKLQATVTAGICSIEGKKFLILGSQGSPESKIFDSEFEFEITSNEQKSLMSQTIDGVLFRFGENWYTSDIEVPKLNIFKYIGIYSSELDVTFPYLGVHGEYDLCNGSRTYKEWCKKAQFLKYECLGICETNTLAGTLAFQLACQDAKIKSILGETVTVSRGIDKGFLYEVKLFAKDYEGWVNLLNINSQIKVFNDNFVEEEYLFSRANGLVCVITTETDLHLVSLSKYQEVFKDDLYYQLDFTEWSSIDKEKNTLASIERYLKDFTSVIKAVIINDSYYLDKEHHHIRKVLNSIGKQGFQNQSKDQYFKPLEDIFNQINELSPSEDWTDKIFGESILNTIEIQDKCNFEIKLGELHLPKYEMTEKEKSSFKTNDELFFALIEDGLNRKIDILVKDVEEYIARIEIEAEVIQRGGFVDYFLITWDIMNWCTNNNILTGPGRGSAAGSLISYLLNITKIDPLKYDLLFERFLNEGRLGKSLPDIDNDIPSNHRDEVKRYLESRYGVDYVTSIGTYGTFKIKSAIKDISRISHLDMKGVNYVTSMIQEDGLEFTDLFKLSTKTPALKEFIQKHPTVIENYPLIEGQVKNSSIHAAGVIIVPKSYNGKFMTIYDWIPVKKMDGVLVTEWEGPQLEASGYLKEDILGVKQLQKLSEILTLIKINHGIDLKLETVPLDDPSVFELFHEGYNEDVFQLGAIGLKAYCRELKPDTIEDLIATVALYRPGPIENGIHKAYIQVKNGQRAQEYDYMMESITQNTFGLIIYQEQIMLVMQVLGGFNLVEADDVRKAMGKKDLQKMKGFKDQFLAGAKEKGCDQFEAIKIWNKLEAFSTYAFNKSHAAAYAHTGYYCQWLKANYPLEFWSIALNQSDSEEIPRRISEMHKVSEVRVLPPDINLSSDKFEVDKTTKEIFWSIGSISFIGEKALETIISERTANGKFFSFSDFYTRINKRSVNKRCVLNLILSGCFDKVEKFKVASDRLKLINHFFTNELSEKIPEELSDSSNNWKDHFWILKQKELTGFGYLDFEKIYKSYIFPKINNNSKVKLINPTRLQDDTVYTKATQALVGIISEILVRNSKKGPFAQLTINSNDENIICLVWSEIWEGYKDIIENSKNKVICITGEVKLDSYRNYNILQTNLSTQVEVL